MSPSISNVAVPTLIPTSRALVAADVHGKRDTLLLRCANVDRLPEYLRPPAQWPRTRRRVTRQEIILAQLILNDAGNLTQHFVADLMACMYRSPA